MSERLRKGRCLFCRVLRRIRQNVVRFGSAIQKEVDSTAKIVFVTPYLDEKYLLYKTEVVPFDEVLYPPLESVPKRLSILKRNEYVVEKSDFIVFFVDHDFGGAAQALDIAKRKGKSFINLAEKQ